ncbi:hypothetical protein [Paeniglutamicibacter gangotriensis]|uniref:Lipoprotein n=1 Tax=Paeniglutamicibacter gangotriensis Lz1y TaxID=1276920 RepID=M7NKV9_9MICC|nr:hypothetical protein [Paeniglutamicibacter gangotriensis]EMQ99188.1 hypothetical protein ADIAG_01178 [Paeniglutamicibacter gangotriensis Lz1y]
MKKRALFLLPLTAALLLAGCSDSAPDAAAGTSAAASSDQLDTQTLADIAKQIAGDNEQAVIMDNDALKAQLPAAEQVRKAIKVTPETCSNFATSDLGAELEKMNVVSVGLPGATALEGLQVQVASFSDSVDAEANFAQADDILKDCSEFSFSLQGQETTMKMKGLEATTSAEKTSAIQSTTVSKETTVTTVSVNALEGSTAIVVTVLGGKDPKKDLAEANQKAENVLEMVAKASA